MTWRPWGKAPTTKLDPKRPGAQDWLTEDQLRVYREVYDALDKKLDSTPWRKHALAWKAAVESA